MSSYEVEIKTLLVSKENADAFLDNMRATGGHLLEKGRHKQLNHYFTGGDLGSVCLNIANYLEEGKLRRLDSVVDRAHDISLRTRLADKSVLIVIKATVDDSSSANGIARWEFESKMVGLTIEDLDQFVLDAGYVYQAKWSRERREFTYNGISVCLDKNAGYGFLAEFELLVDDPDCIPDAKKKIRSNMRELGVEELPQDLLERMFNYYNANWQDYYGTDRMFVIE